MVFGIAPSGQVAAVKRSGYVGVVDYMAHGGPEPPRSRGCVGRSGEGGAQTAATWTQVCRYLSGPPRVPADHWTESRPRVPRWIIDSGCPEATCPAGALDQPGHRPRVVRTFAVGGRAVGASPPSKR